MEVGSVVDVDDVVVLGGVVAITVVCTTNVEGGGATVVGAIVVGTTVVGGTVVGEIVVGATVVGATVVGAMVIGAAVVVGTTLRFIIEVASTAFV